MTTIHKINKIIFITLCVTVILTTLFFISCNKDHDNTGKKTKPSAYSSEVVQKWAALQLRLMRNATGIPNQAFGRHFAYTGIAALESLEPGLHGKQNWSKKWNGLAGLPAANPSVEFYYPANVNAAMASMNRLMFPAATETDKNAIDSLEQALKQEFLTSQSPALIERSAEFGKNIASVVFNWAETDGYKNANNPYTVPTGAGLWKPTAPAFAAPATPYWGNNRTIITGSINGAKPVAPLTYSEIPGSPFYQMVKEVYDASQHLTDDQKAMAIFWRDVPGATTPGHWLSIVLQLVKQHESKLDEAALAYALTGAAINDASIACFKYKYEYNLVRPITYIREVMGNSSWSSFIGTPAHPEYVSAHSSLSMASADVLSRLFNKTTAFTDHTYDYLGFAPRTYVNLKVIATEAGQSRLYAGIHYQPSIDAGLSQGQRVAENIFK